MTALNSYSRVRLRSVTDAKREENSHRCAEQQTVDTPLDDCKKEIEKLEAEVSRKAESFLIALENIDVSYRRETAALLTRFIESVAPRLCKTSALCEARHIIEREVERNNRKITVRVHPQLAPALAQLIQAKREFSDRFDLNADGNPNLNAVEIDWRDGGFLFDPDNLADEFLQLLDCIAREEGHLTKEGDTKDVATGAKQ